MLRRMVLIGALLLAVAVSADARNYTVTPILYKVVYADQVNVDETELIDELPAFSLRTPVSKSQLQALTRSVVKELGRYAAADRKAFTCDLDTLAAGRCRAKRVVVYSVQDGAKGARSIAGGNLAPLSQWDITRRYVILPLLGGYQCDQARLRYDAQQKRWTLDPPSVSCTRDPLNEWVVLVRIKTPATLRAEEASALKDRLRALANESLDASSEKKLVSHAGALERLERSIAASPMVQRALAVDVDFYLDLVVTRR